MISRNGRRKGGKGDRKRGREKDMIGTSTDQRNARVTKVKKAKKRGDGITKKRASRDRIKIIRTEAHIKVAKNDNRRRTRRRKITREVLKRKRRREIDAMKANRRKMNGNRVRRGEGGRNKGTNTWRTKNKDAPSTTRSRGMKRKRRRGKKKKGRRRKGMRKLGPGLQKKNKVPRTRDHKRNNGVQGGRDKTLDIKTHEGEAFTHDQES